MACKSWDASFLRFIAPLGRIGFGQVLFQLRDDFGMQRRWGFCREILPFVWVGLVIVEFFAAIGVSDVSPAFVPNRMVVLPQRGNRDMLPIRVWVFEQRQETDAVEPRIRGQTAKIDQRRIDAQ